MPLTDQIRQAVHDVEPEADVILYGSRSRGDAVSESDWDRSGHCDAAASASRIVLAGGSGYLVNLR